MLIQRMAIFSGQDQEQWLSLNSGFNVIELSDLRTRDTWSRLPAAVLYGVPHPSLSVQQGPSGVRLDCRMQGKELHLIRACTPRTGPAGLLRVFPSEAGTPIPDLRDPDCGKDLLGMESKQFQALFPLRGMPPSRQAALEQAEILRRTRKQEAEQLQQELERTPIPSNDTIARLRGAAVNLETARRGVEKAREERDAVSEALLQTETALGKHPFAGVSAQRLHRNPPKPPRFRPSPLFAVGGVLLALLGGGKLLLPAFLASIPAPAFWGIWGGALLLLLIWLLLRYTQETRRNQKQLEKRFGTEDPTAIQALSETYLELLSQQESLEAQLAEAARSAETLYADFLRHEQAFLLEVRRFAPDACDLTSADQLLRDCAVRRKALRDAQTAAHSAQQQWERLQREAPAPAVPSTVELAETALRESGSRIGPDALIRRAEEILSELNAQSETDSPALLYLSVRLALLELSLPPKAEIPWILDDPLTGLDESAAHALLSWLKSASETRQILLFTGDPRAVAFSRGTQEVSLRRLTQNR